MANLCRAYDAAAAVTVENGGADRAAIGPALRHLADLAYTFPDAAVREDAEYVQSVAHNGYTVPRDFYGSTVAISTRCRCGTSDSADGQRDRSEDRPHEHRDAGGAQGAEKINGQMSGNGGAGKSGELGGESETRAHGADRV